MLKRSNLLLLVLAVILAFITTVVVLKEMGHMASQRSGVQKMTVVEVVKPVQAHQIVDSSDVSVATVNMDALEPGALTSLSEVIGHYTASQWFPGQQVLAAMVTSTNQATSFPLSIPRGDRAFTIGDDAVAGVDHLISLGDHVDVIATFTDKSGTLQVAKTILQDIQVLYVDNPPTGSGTATTGGGLAQNSQNNTKVDTITLALTPGQVTMMEYAETFGQVHIALRNPGDQGTQAVPIVNSTTAMAP